MSRLVTVLCTALVAATALIAASCGGSESAPGSVRLLVFGDPPELEAYRTLIRAFEEAEPEISVQLVEASDRDDLIARLSTSFAGGSPPDLFLMNYRFYGQFAARDVLEPLEDYVTDSEQFELDDFYPQAIDAFRWNGTVTCLPQNISSLVVLSLIHISEPTIIRFAPFIWSNRAELVDDDENPTRFMLDSPAARNALEQFFQLRTLQGVVPPDQEVEAEDDETRFLNGRLAMLLESRRLVPALREAAEFDWDVAALPRHQQPASILHSDAYCLTKASKAKDAAWRFVEYALGPQGAPVIAETGRTVPSLRSVAESDAFLDPSQKPRNAQVFLDAISTIRNVPTVSTWPEIEDAAEPILENGMYLAKPIDEVVAEVDEATRPLFARAE